MEVGISIRDLDLLTIGLVNDIWLEKARDGDSFDQVANQQDYDAF